MMARFVGMAARWTAAAGMAVLLAFPALAAPAPCARKPASACLPGVPAALAAKLARNAPALRTLLGWLAFNEAHFESGERPTQVSAARLDEVLHQFWYDHLGGELEPGPLSLERMERLLAEVVTAQKGYSGKEPWLLICREGTSWPIAKTQAHATRPCVSLRAETWEHWRDKSGNKREAGTGVGLLVLEFGDFARQREPWADGPAPWLAKLDFQVVMALTDGRTLIEGAPHQLPVADLPYELEDWGVPATTALRAENIHAPTPATIPGARVIGTAALFEMMLEDKAPLVIDVVPVKWRRSLPSALQLPNAGVLATEAKYGAKASEINETLRGRLAHVLEQETEGDRNRPVVFLCVSPDCWLSYNAALRAVGEGYRQVLWYRGGTAAWRNAGVPWHHPKRIQFKQGLEDWEKE